MDICHICHFSKGHFLGGPNKIYNFYIYFIVEMWMLFRNSVATSDSCKGWVDRLWSSFVYFLHMTGFRILSFTFQENLT